MPAGLKKLIRDYGPYVEELRRRVLFSAVFFVLLFAGGFALAPRLIGWFVSFFNTEGVSYVVSSPFQAFGLSINIGLSVACIFFLPFILLQAYSYVAPALTQREKTTVIGYALASLAFFVAGFVYGVAILHYATALVVRINAGLGLQNLWDVSTFFSQVLLTSVFLGLLFQFPLVLHALLRWGFVTRELLAAQRRIVVAGCVIMVALLPPTDGLSLMVMALPLVGLFELVLLLNRTGRRAPRATEAFY